MNASSTELGKEVLHHGETSCNGCCPPSQGMPSQPGNEGILLGNPQGIFRRRVNSKGITWESKAMSAGKIRTNKTR